MDIKEKIELEVRNLVLVGEFNPMIFQPMWFAHYGLIGEKEAAEADIKIIHKDVVIFNIDWVTIEVNRQQFIAYTNKSAYYPFFKDLITGTFTLLSHTPINKMGINLEVHYSNYNTKFKREFENKLYSNQVFENILNKPTFNSLTIIDNRSDQYKGYARIRIEPSSKVNDGIYFNINDHYEVAQDKDNIGCGEIMTIFTERWEASYVYGLEIVEKIKNI